MAYVFLESGRFFLFQGSLLAHVVLSTHALAEAVVGSNVFLKKNAIFYNKVVVLIIAIIHGDAILNRKGAMFMMTMFTIRMIL